jgi:hypothetical protein
MKPIIMMRLLLLMALLTGGAATAIAEPYLAVQNGYKCNTCHVNPTGGGLRSDFGVIFAQTLMPAHTPGDAATLWTGRLNEFVRFGGDLRASWTDNRVPNTASRHEFAVEQARLYADVAVIPDRLGIYIDEQVAPNAAENLEAYLRYGHPENGWYFKGGKFYLPFGWRLQDQTALVREVTGISMTTPDQGIELGYELPQWSAQLDLTNGVANAQSGSGQQLTAQVVYIQPRWRLGAAVATTQAEAGNRRVFAVFVGLHTGPFAWLGELDLVTDAGYPEGTRKLVSGLAEVNWRILNGHNVKITGELFDPDRALGEDQQVRYSALYEFTPIPFVQLRAGFRRYCGIPQNDLQNRQLIFVELHGFF